MDKKVRRYSMGFEIKIFKPMTANPQQKEAQ